MSRPFTLRESPLASGSLSRQPVIVLDTNVVLDWLVFRDSSSTSLAAAIAHRQVHWVATAGMRSELDDVLRRGLAVARGVDPAVVLATWDTQVTVIAGVSPLPSPVALHCTDPDDQMFLDLAYAAGARWLLSRDRAVLRLARRASAFGIAITTPEHWSALQREEGGRSRPRTALRQSSID